MKQKKHKKYKPIIFISLLLVIIYVFIELRFTPIPFAGIKELISKQVQMDETLIGVKGDYEGLLAEYKGEKYFLYSDNCIVIKSSDNGNIIGKINLYEKKQMVFSWSKKIDDYLLVLGENYSTESDALEEPVNSGKTGLYNGAIITVIDLKERKVISEKEINEEQVIYLDKNRYGTIKDGIVRIYDFSSGAIVQKESLEKFEKGKKYIVNHQDNTIVFCVENDSYEYEYLDKIVVLK